ncbi:AgrD family cyclic lactone autoinducer peptide [Anaerovorax odorimutans]|nr:cyclic lactone autoinducer peptide [Anaerovorax odorimutans]
MKKFKFTHFIFCSLALMLTAAADMITTTATFHMWYEPECPEELWK